MQQPRDGSQQERRVYVGNLAYEVKWTHLKDFMRQAGEVIHADVLTLPNGRSKGCGIVEYATVEEAQNAVETISNQTLMGRMVYVREDRETEPKFSQPGSTRPSYGGSAPPNGGSTGEPGAQLFVSNLPYNVGWQDLKDLFRSAGNVVRADISQNPDGRSKGTGIVQFSTSADAQTAIEQFNGYDLQGRQLEVRVDRFAGSSGGGGSFAGRISRGGSFRGSDRGGFAGSRRNFVAAKPNDFTDGANGGGEQGDIIYVSNLPWSTTNQDLVELFETVGPVDRAEIQLEPSGRSHGAGVVKFQQPDSATTAISKFSGYNYGNRDLGLSYVSYANSKPAGPEPPAQEDEPL